MSDENIVVEDNAQIACTSLAFQAFLTTYRPTKEEGSSELRRSTLEIQGMFSDAVDFAKNDLADLLMGAGFALCVDYDGHIKWKLYALPTKFD